jgi:hypothetical protein
MRKARRSRLSIIASTSRRTSGTVNGRFFLATGSPQHDQIGVRQPTQRDEAVPGLPRPHLVLVQTDLVFGLGEALLHLPTRSADPEQRGVGTEGQIEGKFLRIISIVRNARPLDSLAITRPQFWAAA